MDTTAQMGSRRRLDLHETGTPCVARVPIFASLSLEEQRGVARLARPTTVAKDDQLYRPGEDVAVLLVVHTGRIKISRLRSEGHEQIVRVLGPGDFIGESAFLDGTRPDHFAVALEPGRLCVLSHPDLGRLVGDHPGIGLAMLRTLSRRLEETEARLAAVISGDVTSRLADYLMSLPVHRVDGVPEVELPMAKKDVASMLDTTPESLSRQLRRLSDSGVIEQRRGRRIRLTDLARLTALSPAG